jgi:ribonuclease D
MRLNRSVIDNQQALSEWLPTLRDAAWIAVDTEADSLHSYPEKLCLIQISIPGQDVLVDPLAGFSISGLLEMLSDRELVFHGADYDLRLLYRTYQFKPRAVFDTMLAAKLLGYSQLGLDALAAKLLGVKLEKGPQKANWARRPLTDRMSHYARSDTRYLQPMAALLREELVARHRAAWHEESCERLLRECAQLRPVARERDDAWRVKGAAELDRAALAILRSLWEWREQEALCQARPPFFILPHGNLVNIAAAAARSKPIDTWLPPKASSRRLKEIHRAIQSALASPPASWPVIQRHSALRLTRAQKRRYEELRQIRDTQAAKLGVEPSIIASRAALVSLAANQSANGDELMRWQRELLNEQVTAARLA